MAHQSTPFDQFGNGGDQNDIVHTKRTHILNCLVKLLEERNPNPQPEMQRKLRVVVQRLEEALFRDSRSLEEYSDESTLKKRLKRVTEIMAEMKNRRTASTHQQQPEVGALEGQPVPHNFPPNYGSPSVSLSSTPPPPLFTGHPSSPLNERMSMHRSSSGSQNHQAPQPPFYQYPPGNQAPGPLSHPPFPPAPTQGRWGGDAQNPAASWPPPQHLAAFGQQPFYHSNNFNDQTNLSSQAEFHYQFQPFHHYQQQMMQQQMTQQQQMLQANQAQMQLSKPAKRKLKHHPQEEQQSQQVHSLPFHRAAEEAYDRAEQQHRSQASSSSSMPSNRNMDGDDEQGASAARRPQRNIKSPDFQEDMSEQQRYPATVHTKEGAGGGPSYFHEEKLELIKQQQQRLQLLRHSYRCTAGDMCKVSNFCTPTKQLWNHISSCESRHCNVPHCLSSRVTLYHYHQCIDPQCLLCGPLRTPPFDSASNEQSEEIGALRNSTSSSSSSSSFVSQSQTESNQRGHVEFPEHRSSGGFTDDDVGGDDSFSSSHGGSHSAIVAAAAAASGRRRRGVRDGSREDRESFRFRGGEESVCDVDQNSDDYAEDDTRNDAHYLEPRDSPPMEFEL